MISPEFSNPDKMKEHWNLVSSSLACLLGLGLLCGASSPRSSYREMVLDKYAFPHVTYPPPDDPLIAATMKGDVDLVKSLLKKKRKKVNTKDREGNTPLIYAAYGSNTPPEIVRILLDSGADVNSQSKDWGEATPFMLALLSDNHSAIPIAEMLLKAGADPNIGNPLLFAVMSDRPDRVRLVLNQQKDQSTNGTKALAVVRYAAQNGSINVLRAFWPNDLRDLRDSLMMRARQVLALAEYLLVEHSDVASPSMAYVINYGVHRPENSTVPVVRRLMEELNIDECKGPDGSITQRGTYLELRPGHYSLTVSYASNIEERHGDFLTELMSSKPVTLQLEAEAGSVYRLDCLLDAMHKQWVPSIRNLKRGSH